MRRLRRQPIRTWTGPVRRYDLIFEGTAAVIAVAVLCVGAALLFGSPDGGLTYPAGPRSAPGSAFTARYWVTSPMATSAGHPDRTGGAVDFADTVVTELAGTSTTATYGPPFNNTRGASQHLAHVSLAGVAHAIFGLTQPINTAEDFVLGPVSQLVAPYNRQVAAAVRTYKAAGGDLTPGVAAGKVASAQQAGWLGAYARALTHGVISNGQISVAPGNYGPVPILVAAELAIARTGALDGYLRSSPAEVSTNPFASTMFFSDGKLWSTIADAQGVGSDQWGVMNELWNYPGQFWLVLYAAPYHIPAIASSSSADLWVGTIVIIVGMLLQLLLPWIPGLRDIPRLIPFYRVMYRRYYARTHPAPRP